jgi:hypothetical protein
LIFAPVASSLAGGEGGTVSRSISENIIQILSSTAGKQQYLLLEFLQEMAFSSNRLPADDAYTF